MDWPPLHQTFFRQMTNELIAHYLEVAGVLLARNFG